MDGKHSAECATEFDDDTECNDSWNPGAFGGAWDPETNQYYPHDDADERILFDDPSGQPLPPELVRKARTIIYGIIQGQVHVQAGTT